MTQYRKLTLMEDFTDLAVYHCFTVRGSIATLICKDKKTGKVLRARQYTRREDVKKIIEDVISDLEKKRKEIEARNKKIRDKKKVAALMAKYEERQREYYGIDNKALPNGVCIR